MVYLTGDTHGDIDRFKHGKLRWLGKRDTVVVLGDFGFVWDGSKGGTEKAGLAAQAPVYPAVSGRQPRKLRPFKAVSHRGTLWRQGAGTGRQCVPCVPRQRAGIGEKKYLCFGGAESQDVEDREPGVNWWREEMPSEEEYAFCEENLAACDYKVDYVC